MLSPLQSSPLFQSTPLQSYDVSQALLTFETPFSSSSSSLSSTSLQIGTAPSGLDIFLDPVTSLAPLNQASEPWIRSLVWADFRVAVACFVVCPLVLLGWAMALCFPSADSRSTTAETVLRLMTSYWQASSLLLLTVLLNISESNLGVGTGLLAQAMIVVSLLWWEDLNQKVQESNEIIGQVYQIWSKIAILSAAAGVLIQAPFQSCLGVFSLSNDAYCAPWLEPPKFAAGLLGLTNLPIQLATAGCALYFLVLGYYIIILIPQVGRSGRAKRPSLMNVATPIAAWTALGFLDPSHQEDESTNKPK